MLGRCWCSLVVCSGLVSCFTCMVVGRSQVVGEVYFQMGDKVVKRMPMVALDKVEEAGFFGRMWDSMALWFED